MAFRIGDEVVCGEIINTSNYSTHGWLELRGRDQPVTLQLTGNCSEDLAGRHIRFEARQQPAAPVDADPSDPESDDGPPGDDDVPKFTSADRTGLAWQQVGPTGTMTAARKVNVADCSVEELRRRRELGEPPPARPKRCLYLEWFSQNGRVVIELVDPEIEFVEEDAIDDAGDEQADNDTAEIQDETPPFDSSDNPFDDEDEDEEDNPFQLIPDELQQQLDADAWATDREIEYGGEKPDVIREMELMDDLIEQGEGDPVGMLFDGPVKLPRPEQLNDEQVEESLKSLLAQLALYGIALHVCEHFTPRDTYRLLLEEICTEEHAYGQLRGTGWVQHFMTSEFCQKCDEEFDREYERRERERKENPHDDDAMPDNDIPF